MPDAVFNPSDSVKPHFSHGTRMNLVSALILGALALPPLCAGAEPDRRYTLAEAIGWETLLMPGGNMEPAIRLHETLLVDVRAHRARPLRPGDIVAYDVPRHPTDPAIATAGPTIVFVMRVAAVAGDRIAVIEGRARRNGERVDEPGVDLSGLSPLTANASEVTVPTGHVYVLGDKRGNSNDSRLNGPVPLAAVRGVVRFAGPAALQGPFRALGSPSVR